jgi:hypothetical protein
MKAMAQTAWLKAWRTEGGLSFLCPTEAEAIRMRFTLYNAVKALRKADPDDPRTPKELWQAVQGMTVRMEGTTVRLVKHADTNVGRLLAAAAGAEIMSAEDQAAAEAEKRLRERLDLPGPGAPAAAAVRKTPYYTREG